MAILLFSLALILLIFIICMCKQKIEESNKKCQDMEQKEILGFTNDELYDKIRLMKERGMI